MWNGSVRFERRVPDTKIATTLAASGFAKQVSPELYHDVQDHINHGQMVYTITDAGVVVGFAIFNQMAHRMLYLSGVILNPEHQGMGIARQMVRHVVKDTGSVFLALRTQSLRMWVAGYKTVRDWFPNPAVQTPGFIKELGNEMAGFMGCVYPVTEGCYGGPLYGEKPMYHDADLQCWWDDICDFQRGDAVICVGVL